MLRVLCLVIISVFTCSHQVQAQEDMYLCQLVKAVKSLRTGKDKSRELVARQMGDKRKPKITLLDNIGTNANELTGKNAYAFSLNKVVALAYRNQNNMPVTQGRYFNSNEAGIAYSAIEKTLKSGTTTKYSLSGHLDVQELVVVAYRPATQFTIVVSVNEKIVKKVTVKELTCIKTPSLKKTDIMTIEISLPTNLSGGKESFAFINYNSGVK